MFSRITLESERLRCQELREEDAEKLFQIYSDKEAMKFRGSKAMETLTDAYDMIQNQFLIEGWGIKQRWGIWNKVQGQLIGTLLLIYKKEHERQLEVGFSFDKKQWNQGYATEVLKMIEHSASELKEIAELKAWCVEENKASVRLFEKAKFTEVAQNEYPESKLFVKRI